MCEEICSGAPYMRGATVEAGALWNTQNTIHCKHLVFGNPFRSILESALKNVFHHSSVMQYSVNNHRDDVSVNGIE